MNDSVAGFFSFFFMLAAVFWVNRVYRRGKQRIAAREAANVSQGKPEALAAEALSSVKMTIESGYQQTEEDRRFEAAFADGVGANTDKHFYSWVAGIEYTNPDGVNRENLIARCETCELVRLNREPGNSFDSNAVMVLSPKGECLGYLKRQVAAQISGEVEQQGRVWFGMVRRVALRTEKSPAGLLLCLFRMSESFIGEQVQNTLNVMGKAEDKSAAAMIKTGVAVGFMESLQR